MQAKQKKNIYFFVFNCINTTYHAIYLHRGKCSICQVLDWSCMFDLDNGSAWYVGALRRSVAILLPEVPILEVLLKLIIKPLTPLLVASLVPRLVASLPHHIVVMSSALKSIFGARGRVSYIFLSH